MRIPRALERTQCSPNRLARRGAAAVEFAVIAPFLVAIMLGMIEVTRAIQVKNYLTDTARSGCRLAVKSGSTTQAVKDNINTVLTSNGLDSSYATISVLVNNKDVDLSTANQYDQISVKISLPISKVNWLTPLFFSSTVVESESLVMMHQ